MGPADTSSAGPMARPHGDGHAVGRPPGGSTTVSGSTPKNVDLVMIKGSTSSQGAVTATAVTFGVAPSGAPARTTNPGGVSHRGFQLPRDVDPTTATGEPGAASGSTPDGSNQILRTWLACRPF